MHCRKKKKKRKGKIKAWNQMLKCHNKVKLYNYKIGVMDNASTYIWKKKSSLSFYLNVVFWYLLFDVAFWCHRDTNPICDKTHKVIIEIYTTLTPWKTRYKLMCSLWVSSSCPTLIIDHVITFNITVRSSLDIVLQHLITYFIEITPNLHV